ncbi:MAG TPA: dihydrolipoamide acetyltransferase family protein [Thermoplasmataceae archaeon]|nr:2-oxo acid dehydrogenase subunit E2 [Thermoplasmatales archaeon AK]HLH86146.1 dihydrolipoamide acetyltransferase family protein [Thermoplasmataceae archaeon]
MYSFKLPDIGEGVTEGEIVKWHVKEGDQIRSDQDMVEVMTDKVTVKIPSPVTGTVSKILVPEGTVVKVGQSLIDIQTGSETEGAPEAVKQPSESRSASDQAHPGHVLESEEPIQVMASPAVRRIARERGIDLSRVKGTGEGGRITLDDLEKFVSGSAQGQPEKIEVKTETAVQAPAPHTEPVQMPPQPEAASGDKRFDIKGLRRIIFEKMSKSKEIMPHFTVVEEADLTRIRDILDGLSRSGEKITYTAFFIKAVTVALKEFPYLNAIYNEKEKNYTLRSQYNIGIAVDTEAGLTVAVIKNADTKSIASIASEVSDLASRARRGELKLDEVQGSTFTITNVGTIGGLISTPIINYPEVAILGVHRIRELPGTQGRYGTYLSLSCDHRLIDGAMATRFLVRVKNLMESPELFMVR